MNLTQRTGTSYDYRLRVCFMVVDVDCTVVEACQKPGFCGMEIDAFDVM
jgi:hypothetical protein